MPSPTQNGYSPNVSGDQPTELAENPKPKQGPENCYMEGSGPDKALDEANANGWTVVSM